MFHVKHFKALCFALVLSLLLFPVKANAIDYTINIPDYHSIGGEYPLLALLLMALGLVTSGQIEIVPNSTILGMAIDPADRAVLEQIIEENKGVATGDVVELTPEEITALSNVANALDGQSISIVIDSGAIEDYTDVDNALLPYGCTVPVSLRNNVDEALEFADYFTMVLYGSIPQVIISESPVEFRDKTTYYDFLVHGPAIRLAWGTGGVFEQYYEYELGYGYSSGVLKDSLPYANAQTYSVSASDTLHVVDALKTGVTSGTVGLVDPSTTVDNVGTQPIYVTVPITINYPSINDNITDVQHHIGEQIGAVPVTDIENPTLVTEGVSVASSFVGELAAYQIPLLLTKVPFCFLTDAARIMGMFVQDPVTPELNFDLPTGIDAEGELTYTHIDADFHQYDDLASTVRFWETIGFFACFLILMYQQKHGGD